MGMDLSQGGHLTHGSPVNMSGKNYHFISYGVGADGVIDYAELEKQVRKVRPKMLVAGASAYPAPSTLKSWPRSPTATAHT